MRNKFMQPLIGTFLGLALLFGCTQVFVSAQSSEPADSPNFLLPGFGTGIEGVWRSNITQTDCQSGIAIRNFQGLLTFNEGGTIAETSSVTSPALRSPGHGVWKKVNGKSYSGAFIFLRFNPDGSFAGTQKVTQSFLLNSFGNTFKSTGSVQVFDQNDNLLGSGCSTSTGTRFE